MENRYAVSSLDNDCEIPKNQDLTVINMLQSANEILPSEEGYSFFVTAYQPMLKPIEFNGTVDILSNSTIYSIRSLTRNSSKTTPYYSISSLFRWKSNPPWRSNERASTIYWFYSDSEYWRFLSFVIKILVLCCFSQIELSNPFLPFWKGLPKNNEIIFNLSIIHSIKYDSIYSLYRLL